MQQQYDTAFSIYFKHAFFSDSKLRSLVVSPTTETEQLLRNSGGIIKAFDSGIHVLYQSFFAGKERSRAVFMEDEGELKFLLKNTDEAFFAYTGDFDTDISAHCFCFYNGKNQAGRQQGALHLNKYVGREALRPVSECARAYFAKPFGIITIRLHRNLEESFSVTFCNTSTYWCYVLTRADLQELSCPAVICKTTKEAFAGPEQIQLPDGRTALAFRSTAPIAHLERPVSLYQLVEAYDNSTLKHKVVLPALPHPDSKHISFIAKTAEQKGKNISYIFI